MLNNACLNPDGSLLRASGLGKFVSSPGSLWRARKTRQTLKNVSFSVQPGERIGLVGVSGAGKTTLLNLLLAMDRADEGSVTCHGRPITPASVRSLRWYRRAVQYIPQDPASSLNPDMSVRELVREPLCRLRVECDHQQRVAESLEQVGLGGEFMQRRPAQLSGGQAQRVAIARAISVRPQLLLADEPLSGLDLPLQDRICGIFEHLNHCEGVALMIVSHDLSMVSRLCERSIILDKGCIIEDRPTDELFSAPRHKHTAALINAASINPLAAAAGSSC